MNLSDLIKRLPPSYQGRNWRPYVLDGGLLLFDRKSGINVLLEDISTKHFKRIAPRTLLVGITNDCNLNCPFCYRDRQSGSTWTYESLMSLCKEADCWGVLEMAFGGGEPLLFPGWEEFICEFHESTGMSLSFSTNGMDLSGEFLEKISGKYGQIRLSLYKDNGWEKTLRTLVNCGARFGVNWLITPSEVAGLQERFCKLLSLGARDVLLLRYKGRDSELHLNSIEEEILLTFVKAAYNKTGSHIALKMDVCFGESLLSQLPTLFEFRDCGAGDEILSITCDRKVKVCSFQENGVAFESIDELRAFWDKMRAENLKAKIPGCGRGRCATAKGNV